MELYLLLTTYKMPLKLRNRTLNTAGVAPRSIGTV